MIGPTYSSIKILTLALDRLQQINSLIKSIDRKFRRQRQIGDFKFAVLRKNSRTILVIEGPFRISAVAGGFVGRRFDKPRVSMRSQQARKLTEAADRVEAARPAVEAGAR